MQIKFDENANQNEDVKHLVETFFENTSTLELKENIPIVIFQDGVKGAYYVKCSIKARDASLLFDFDAKLDTGDSFRANRELLLQHNTFKKMLLDASSGREFNDVIVEFNKTYNPDKPLKIWGGQHRSRALSEANTHPDRYHGFRIYFNLSTDQRTEIALISNTNISVSNDTFDRLLEETMYGDTLRKWCKQVGLLDKNDDFPDVGSKFEKITVKLARSFIVNFYLAKDIIDKDKNIKIDKMVHEPYLAETGTERYLTEKTGLLDIKYQQTMKQYKDTLLKDKKLLEAGKAFSSLHKAQQTAVKSSKGKTKNRKSYRNKALIESILTGWSYVAGILQNDPSRLRDHYKIPKTSSKIPDPLNAEEMSYKHDQDKPTYRGLGTRSSLKDRQRIAQLFLAKSLQSNAVIDKTIMNKAVSQVIGLISFKKGYTNDI